MSEDSDRERYNADRAEAEREADHRLEEAVNAIVLEVQEEVLRAMRLHGPMVSAHEGYAVILEELDELWENVRMKQSLRDPDALEQEARQLAAMAVRFIFDIVRSERTK